MERTDGCRLSSGFSDGRRLLIRLVIYSISIKIKVELTSLRLNINLTLRLINRSEQLVAHF